VLAEDRLSLGQPRPELPVPLGRVLGHLGRLRSDFQQVKRHRTPRFPRLLGRWSAGAEGTGR
jgi:hypothetical protein